jgi:diamine N-acetyltransferase
VAEDPDLLVVGERVALGPLRVDLADRYARWVNQAEVKVGLDALGIATPESERTWIDRAVTDGADRSPRAASFTVYDRRDLVAVGTCAIIHIDHRARRGEFGIALGERRGQGLGTEAARLTLDWGFNVLSLHNIMLRTLAWNERAVRSYERAGFRLVGRRRQAVLSRGRLVDEVIMDALSTEFSGSVLGLGGS